MSQPQTDVINRTVMQAEFPCRLHKNHTPQTRVNERHHIFPQALQIQVWGKVMDWRVLDICATSHNTIHYIMECLLNGRELPNGPLSWPRPEKALAKEGIKRFLNAQAIKDGRTVDYVQEIAFNGERKVRG